MTLKQQATNMLQNLPDEKMTYVIDMLKWVTDVLDEKSIIAHQAPVDTESNSSQAIEAWAKLKMYKGIIPYDIDFKAELAEARDEKYAE